MLQKFNMVQQKRNTLLRHSYTCSYCEDTHGCVPLIRLRIQVLYMQELSPCSLFWQLSLSIFLWQLKPASTFSLRMSVELDSKYGMQVQHFTKCISMHIICREFACTVHAVIKPAVQLLQIQEVHPGPHSNACNFLLFLSILSYLSYLYHTSLLGLQTKTRWQRNSSFFSFKSHNSQKSMSSVVNVFVHAIRKHLKKCLVQKVGSLGLIPMIQPSFNSSCVALKYEPGNKFFHRAVPKLQDIKFSEKNHFQYLILSTKDWSIIHNTVLYIE